MIYGDFIGINGLDVNVLCAISSCFSFMTDWTVLRSSKGFTIDRDIAEDKLTVNNIDFPVQLSDNNLRKHDPAGAVMVSSVA